MHLQTCRASKCAEFDRAGVKKGKKKLPTLIFLSGDVHARRPLHKMDGVFFFFILSVSCWNIRFGAISNFRSTHSTSFWENLRNRVHLYRKLWIFEMIFSPRFSWFRKRSPSIPVNSLSASLCSALEANYIFKTKRSPSTQECIHEGLSRFRWDLPHMPAFCCSSRHFTHFAIYRIIFGVGNFSRGFSSVASVNVRFSWVFYFVFICSGYKLNSPHYIMGGMPRPVFIRGFHDFLKSRFSSRILVYWI